MGRIIDYDADCYVCGTVTNHTCDRCNKPICDEHELSELNEEYCPECFTCTRQWPTPSE